MSRLLSFERPPPTPSPERPSVLVIEDNDDARDLLRRMLERAGYTAVTAREGAEGVARFRSGGFALVITDITMPVMDGFEVIRALRAEGSNVPILAVSGMHDWDGFLRMAVALGANAALQKPLPRELFLKTVSSLVEPPWAVAAN